MNNDDKILEILVSMQSDMKELRSDINGMQSNISSIQSDITGMQSDINEIKSDVKELNRKVTIIYDRTADLAEFETQTNNKLDDLQTDINSITAKTANNNNKIIELSRKINTN